MYINDKIFSALEQGYTKNDLHQGFWPYIKAFFSETTLHVADVRIQQFFEKKQKNKEELLMLVAAVFSSEKLFREFLSILPEEVQRLFGVLVWEEGLLAEDEIRSQYGIDTTERSRGYGWREDRDLKKEFMLFQNRRVHDWQEGYRYLLGLPEGLRKELREYFDKPEGYYLQPLEAIPEGLLQFRGEEMIFQELPRLLAYTNQGNIKRTNSGIPVASTYSKMRKTLSAREFYEELKKPFDTIRTTLLATLISDAGPLNVAQEGIRTLQQLFTFFVRDFFPLHLPQHLKGLGRVDNRYKDHVGKELMVLLQQFPEEDGWISMENLLKFSGYHSYNFKPAGDYQLKQYVYYPVDNKGWVKKEYITDFNFHQLIKEPLLKAGFYLFAAFGLVEAAYEQPLEAEEKEDRPTPYDGLRYVRLTPLGAFLSGRTKNYSPPETEEKAKISLLDDSLNILSDKPSETVDLLLDNYTEKVGPTRYRTDFGIFMKGIRNEDELESKINLFMQTVSSKLPPNWQAFFQTLRLKCDPLKSIGAHMAFQLSKEDQELINLVAKDPILKNLVIKAEGLIILVMKNDLAKFKNRLKEFGYLLE